tara:strand:- start:1215 stop:1634 length:420 start_codon:yes stop_codon:yes gene_type:complete
MSYDENNVFAKILREEMPAHRVYEDSHTLAFMDIMPVSKGHTLVIPKSKSENIFELNEEYLSAVIKTTKRVADAIKVAFSPSGVIMTQLNGAKAGQTVFHYHMHIIPVYEKAPFQPHAYDVEDDAVLASAAEEIKQILG